MLAPIARSSVARSALQGSRTMTTSSAVRAVATHGSMVTKEEKWTHEDAAAAAELPQGKVVLSEIVPSIEARWKDMSRVEQYAVYRQLEELQRKDWTQLSIDEKKAAYFVSFGPHGPRKPLLQPGQAVRTAVGVLGLLGATAVVFFGFRSMAPPPPKTMTKEYQEQMNQRALEENINPITGISSEGYAAKGGKGHVQ
ncbi:unnamed protein product [Sympodiomycopsis kandeliae]